MSENLLSIRMHASLYGRHLSGAERLIDEAISAEEELLSMLRRALEHPRGKADQISFKIEEIPLDTAVSGSLLNFSGYLVDDWQQGRKLAGQLLTDAGVSPQAVNCAFAALADGAAPDGSSMRGAMLIDAQRGERLEADPSRGVRVSRMDLTRTARDTLQQQLATLNLDNAHVVEALTLASKVISAPGVIAELCWSDDPEYTAGYVTSADTGYQRISQLKPAGEERGGRAFFVQQQTDGLEPLIQYLEKTPYLIDRIAEIEPGVFWPEHP